MAGDRYLEPEVETMSREQLHALHEQRVLELVPHAYENAGKGDFVGYEVIQYR